MHKDKILRRFGRALSTAVQLLLRKKQQQKQKQKHEWHKPSHDHNSAVHVVGMLRISLSMLLEEAWTATAPRSDTDNLQVAVQVAESGVLTPLSMLLLQLVLHVKQFGACNWLMIAMHVGVRSQLLHPSFELGC